LILVILGLIFGVIVYLNTPKDPSATRLFIVFSGLLWCDTFISQTVIQLIGLFAIQTRNEELMLQSMQESEEQHNELLDILGSDAKEILLLRIIEKKLKQIDVKLSNLEKFLNDYPV
jgi:hypothetical protein